MLSPLQKWALHHLKPLIDYLDDSSLLQIIETAERLRTPEEVAVHFSGLLGEDHKSVSFISEFNSRKFASQSAQNSIELGKVDRKSSKVPAVKKPVGNTMMSSELGLKSKPVVHAQPKSQPKLKKVDALTEIDAALRALELTTSTAANTKQITCDCAARRHGLNQVSPNCLSCGKIICTVESYTRCSFCHAELLTRSQKDEIIAELKRERGVESNVANNQHQKRKATAGTGMKVAYAGKAGANYSSMPQSTTSQMSTEQIEQSMESATKRKEELLNHISSGYRRTVIDQASDFTAEASDKWSTPAQRALALRQAQAKLLASEDRGRVISLTLNGGKVKMQNSKREVREHDVDAGIEREQRKIEVEKEREEKEQEAVNKAYTPNELMQDLRQSKVTRPIPQSGESLPAGSDWWKSGQRKGWRRVQDYDDEDQDDDSRNERIILDSGTLDGQPGKQEVGTSKKG